jgi:hypothetical protein
MKTYDQYTYDDAGKLFPPDRRSDTAKTATEFFKGNHWLKGKGFVGELPPRGMKGYIQTINMIRDGFVSENIVGEVIENQEGGLFGREPIWSFLSDDGTKKEKAAKETYAPLTDWWNERERLSALQEKLGIILCEGIAVGHIFFSKGKVESKKGEDGKVPKLPDLKAGLEMIYCENLRADVAGVFTDPETQAEIGVYLFERATEVAGQKEKCAEISYLDKDGNTVLRVLRKDKAPEEFGPYRLGGRLFVHEARRKPLITEQVQSNQKAANLANTMMQRNVNLAGARERTVANAQHPKAKKKVADAQAPGGVKEVVEQGVYVTGGGAVNFLMGWPIYNEKGQVVGYTNPNVTITDPVSPVYFVDTRNHYYGLILSQCQQKYKLLADEATPSGKSRTEARAEYESSLKKSKTPMDASGRWELETVLRLAAELAKESEKYLNLRADFNCLIDAGVPDAETRRVVMDMRKPGGPNNEPLISDETARNWVGIDDNEAEVGKIEEEAKRKKNEPPPPPTNQPPAPPPAG